MRTGMKSALAAFSAGDSKEEDANEPAKEEKVEPVQPKAEKPTSKPVQPKAEPKVQQEEPKIQQKEPEVQRNEPVQVVSKAVSQNLDQHCDDKVKQVGKVNRNGNSFPQNYVLLRVDQSDTIIQLRNGVNKYNGRVSASVEFLASQNPLEFTCDNSGNYSVVCPTNNGKVTVQLTDSSISQLTVIIPIQFTDGQPSFVEQIAVYDTHSGQTKISSTYWDAESDTEFFSANVVDNGNSFSFTYEVPETDSKFTVEVPKQKGFSLVSVNVSHNGGTTRDLRCFQC